RVADGGDRRHGPRGRRQHRVPQADREGGRPGGEASRADRRVSAEVRDPVLGRGAGLRRRRDRPGGDAAAADQGPPDARDEAGVRSAAQARERAAVTPRRFELPDGLSEEEERAVIAALERYFGSENPRPVPWVLQGRIAAARQGTLQ